MEKEKKNPQAASDTKERKSSQAKINANERYNKKAYDRIHLSVRKDADINGDVIRAHAEARGESVNAFLLRAVMEAMERDNTAISESETSSDE